MIPADMKSKISGVRGHALNGKSLSRAHLFPEAVSILNLSDRAGRICGVIIVITWVRRLVIISYFVRQAGMGPAGRTSVRERSRLKNPVC